jgi:hypothetical protein
MLKGRSGVHVAMTAFDHHDAGRPEDAYEPDDAMGTWRAVRGQVPVHPRSAGRVATTSAEPAAAATESGAFQSEIRSAVKPCRRHRHFH